MLTVNESVFRTLRSEIAAGKLAPGTRLVHRHLARRLGTSNIPVVDALRRLEGVGLLVSVPGIGSQVRTWQPHEVEDAYRVRAALEGIAALLAKQVSCLGAVKLTPGVEQRRASGNDTRGG